MIFLYLCLVVGGLTGSKVSGRAVNISSAWFLPQEGFPVFYRYFNDKVTWNEAEAVCGFHHADLLSVQSSSQMDAARAYVKEIDVTDNIWIGLRKESPEKAFSWTNGEKLLGDGYWIEPIPKTNEKLCAAIDPISDFRWNSFYCRGPQVASFICELPVPEWAKKEDGCMITSLPSLTVTLMPEMDVVQLFSDCGLEGTRRIACKGGVNREEIIRRLSCDVDVFASTIFSKSTTDAIKEINTQQNTWSSGSEEANRHETTQTLTAWEPYPALTRHRRASVLSSLGKAFAEEPKPPPTVQSEETTVTETTSTQSKAQAINIPSHIFPHPPYPASGRSEPTTKTSGGTTTPKEQMFEVMTEKKPEGSTWPGIFNISSTNSPPSLKTDAATKDINASSDTLASATGILNSVGNKDLPVLIITGKALNDSLILNPATPTSENPEFVFMIGNKEVLAEPYLVPLADDVLINNPSLSPVEVINVDLIEVDNLTTKGTTIAPSQASPPRKPESIHPLRLGEKRGTSSYNQSSVTSLELTSTSSTPKSSTPNSSTSKSSTPNSSTSNSSTPKSSPIPKTDRSELENKTEESLNVVEGEGKGEGLEIPQRPNRGRLLTHSSHPSFYPYFLNRVLG